MIKCKNCERENRDEARYCRYCGAELPVTLANVTLTGQATPEVQSQPQEIEPEATLEATPILEQGQDMGELHEQPLIDDQEPIQGQNQVVEEATDQESGGVPQANIDRIVLPDQEDASLEAAELEGEAGSPMPSGSPAPTQGQELVSAPAELEQRLDVAESITGGLIQPGEILQERFHVTHVSETDAGQVLITAEDLKRCWVCQAVQSDPSPNYCEECGAQLTEKPLVLLHILPDEVVPEQDSDIFVENGITYKVEIPSQEVAQSEKPLRLRLNIGYQSDVGRERDIDEDSILIMQVNALCEMRNSPELGFFAVADGIGGYEAGEVASRTAIQALEVAVLEKIFLPVIRQTMDSVEDLSAALVEAVLAANQAVFSLRTQAERDSNMGCTLTAALIRESSAIVVNVGDSRTYLMSNGVLSKVTNDHSIVARLLERGMIQPEEVYTHEQKGVIYRSLGDKPALEVDTFRLELTPGERLLLCCDGVWEMVRDPYIEDTLLELYDPQQACDRLVQMANLSGGEDNISVIVVNVEELRWHKPDGS